MKTEKILEVFNKIAKEFNRIKDVNDLVMYVVKVTLVMKSVDDAESIPSDDVVFKHIRRLNNFVVSTITEFQSLKKEFPNGVPKAVLQYYLAISKIANEVKESVKKILTQYVDHVNDSYESMRVYYLMSGLGTINDATHALNEVTEFRNNSIELFNNLRNSFQFIPAEFREYFDSISRVIDKSFILIRSIKDDIEFINACNRRERHLKNMERLMNVLTEERMMSNKKDDESLMYLNKADLYKVWPVNQEVELLKELSKFSQNDWDRYDKSSDYFTMILKLMAMSQGFDSKGLDAIESIASVDNNSDVAVKFREMTDAIDRSLKNIRQLKHEADEYLKGLGYTNTKRVRRRQVQRELVNQMSSDKNKRKKANSATLMVK